MGGLSIRRRLAAASASAVVLLFAVAGLAAADGTEELVPTAVTVPGSNPLPDMPVLDMEVESFASGMDVDLETARSMLESQQTLVEFAQSARLEFGYSGFEVVNEPPNVRGVLAVTDPERVVVPDGLPVTVIRASISEVQMADFGSTHTQLLRELLPTVQAVTYSPTSDIVYIWATETDLSPADQKAIGEFLKVKSPEVFRSATIQFRIGETGSFNYGGLKESKAGGTCTSGFGGHRVINGVLTGGYITAGHCRAIGGVGWSVVHPTGNKVVNGYHSLLVSTWGYQDRVVFLAASSSFLVRITPAVAVDMSATAGHIVLGTHYCHYGASSNVQRCGTIQEVNYPIVGGGYTVLASRTSVTCQGGDSGGPVWRPINPRIPSGLISGGTPAGQCLYVALDDQLTGTGWVLQ